jgi:hypothetical protein
MNSQACTTEALKIIDRVAIFVLRHGREVFFVLLLGVAFFPVAALMLGQATPKTPGDVVSLLVGIDTPRNMSYSSFLIAWAWAVAVCGWIMIPTLVAVLLNASTTLDVSRARQERVIQDILTRVGITDPAEVRRIAREILGPAGG